MVESTDPIELPIIISQTGTMWEIRMHLSNNKCLEFSANAPEGVEFIENIYYLIFLIFCK